MYSRKKSQNDKSHSKNQSSYEEFSNRRGTVIPNLKEEDNKSNSKCK